MSDDKVRQSLIENKALFIDAVRGRKPKRVPLLSHVWTWKVFDAGYKFSECLFDYDKMANAMYQFHEKYDFDLYMDLGNRNPIKMLQNFDAEIYTVDDENGYLNFMDRDAMDAPQGLMDMAEKGMIRYTYENILPNKYNVKDSADAIARLVAAAKEFKAFSDAFAKVQGTMTDKYGVPALCKGRYDVPAEVVFSAGLRGIKSFSMDMRRYPDLLEKMFAVMEPTTSETFYSALNTFADDERMVFPVRLTCLAHTIMNAKQFERFYWPALKHFGDELEKRDMCAFMFVEGSINHVYDFYQELSKDRIALMFEQDDPKLFKEKLPNVTPVGGFPLDLLSKGTPEQCVDKAKEMLDIMAYDGRWIYASNKMISYRNDARGENLKAVNDYLRKCVY